MIKASGLDPVLVGVLITLQVAIGAATPPFGCNLFTAIAVFRRPFVEVVRRGTALPDHSADRDRAADGIPTNRPVPAGTGLPIKPKKRRKSCRDMVMKLVV